MVLFPIVIFACYFALLGFLILGWNRLVRKKSAWSEEKEHFVSVIIPARNEESNIGQLLADLENQVYNVFEVIVVDDHSEDNTVKVVEGFMERNSRFRVLANSGVGKKTALTLGVQSSKGSIVITTDADCRVSREWISTLVGSFSNDGVKMVIASVRMEANSAFSNLQAIEFASLIGSGMAMAAWKLPVMCNGANLAFRKSVFEEVGGYEGNLHIPSGDDEFLMRKVLNAYAGGIEPSTPSQSVVTTLPNRTFKDLFQQRIRWAGKWTTNQSIVSRLLAVFVFCFHLTTVLLPLLLAIKWIDVQTIVLLLLTRACLELLFLKNVGQYLNLKWSWVSFAILQVLYPVYVVVIGLLSHFNSFEWKGRKLKSLMVSNKLNKEILG